MSVEYIRGIKCQHKYYEGLIKKHESALSSLYFTSAELEYQLWGLEK